MKTPRLFSLMAFSLLLFSSLFAQEDNSNGQQSSNTPSLFTPTNVLTNIDQTCTWDSLRFLEEINRSGLPEAYPWLSADGLRLYYTRGRPDIVLKDSLFMAERPSLDDPFGNSQQLNLTTNDRSNISCWLTDDELEMYFMIRDDTLFNTLTLYHVDRPTINDDFSEPQPITLLGTEPGFYAGPSLTPDKSQLFIYTVAPNSQIAAYDRVDDSTYSFSYTLPNPNGAFYGPGQLSKDGLRFYHVIGTDLYYWERTDLNASFAPPVSSLGGAINESNPFLGQPTFNGDGSRMIYVGSNGVLFNENDFYEGIKSDVLNSTEDPRTVDETAIQLFPNPAHTTLHVKDQSGLFQEVHILDLLGKKMVSQTLPIQASPLSIDIQNLHNGIYFAQFRSSTGMIITRKFLVKK